MKIQIWRIGLGLSILFLGSISSPVADMEPEIRARLLGAWVITHIETYSDCRGKYTNNRINGNLVKSGGSYRFQVGELGKVEKIHLHRSRIDVLLSIPEKILAPYGDGPFTLYRELRCRVELEVELPRQMVKKKDSAEVVRMLGALFEGHSRRDQAEESSSWNQREMEPYPDDYDLTLQRHEIWQAEQLNASIQARIDQAVEETSQVVNRVNSDPDYLAGFGVGVEEARAVDLENCPALMAVRFMSPPRPSSGDDAHARAEDRGRQGARDGTNLVFGVELIRRLPACFVPIPELPPRD